MLPGCILLITFSRHFSGVMCMSKSPLNTSHMYMLYGWGCFTSALICPLVILPYGGLNNLLSISFSALAMLLMYLLLGVCQPLMWSYVWLPVACPCLSISLYILWYLATFLPIQKNVALASY